MLEDPNGRTRKSAAENERGVIELIAQYQRSLLREALDVGGVGGEAHAEDGTRLHTQEAGHHRLQAADVVIVAILHPGRANADALVVNGFDNLVVNCTSVLGKAQIIVRAHVHHRGGGACVSKTLKRINTKDIKFGRP